MIRRLAFGAALAALLISTGSPQVGPLPGMVVLPPPRAASGGACGTPAVTSIGTQSADATGSISLTGVTVPAGSLIIVEASAFGATAGTVSDGVNSYSVALPPSTVNGSALFYAPNASLSGGAITYTPNGVSNFTRAMSAVYVSNIATSNPLDGAVSNSATGSGNGAASITSGTPSQSGELFVGLLGGDGSSSTTASMTQDTGNGWSFPPNFRVDPAGAGTFIGGGTQVNAGTGTKTFAPTISATSGGESWVVAVYGFKHC